MSPAKLDDFDQAILLGPAKDIKVLEFERGLEEAIRRLRYERAEFRKSICNLQSELRKLQGVREIIVKPVQSYALGMLLVATLTFMTHLLPPGGFDEDGQLRTGIPFTIFCVCCSMSFYLSIGGLILCLGCALPHRDDTFLDSFSLERDDADIEWTRLSKLHVEATDRAIEHLLETIIKYVGVNAVLVVSICFCVGAFAAAGFASTSPGLHVNRLAVLCTSSAGFAAIGSSVLQLVTHAYSEKEVSQDPTISQVTRIWNRFVHFFEVVSFLISVMFISFLPGVNLVRLFGFIHAQLSSDLKDSTLFEVLGLDKLFAVYGELERRTKRNAPPKCCRSQPTSVGWVWKQLIHKWASKRRLIQMWSTVSKLFI